MLDRAANLLMKPWIFWCLFGWTVSLWVSAPAFAQTVEICNNGIDDDGDNLVDCQDPDCPECAQTITCAQTNTYYMPPTYGNTAIAGVFDSQDLVLSTDAPVATVTIRTADNSYVRTVAVTTNGSTIVALPLTVVQSTSSGVIQMNKGLIIQSDEPIQATYRQTASVNQDIIPLKGRAALGYAFYAASQTQLRNVNNAYDERHFVGVMATQPNTVVTFRSPIALEGITAALNTPFSVTLNAGQTYLVSSKVLSSTASENKSVSGVLVTSNQPIVVNSGSQHTQQPYGSSRDAGMDQLVPARLTGQQYVAVHGQNTTANSDYVIIVAIEKATSLTITGPATSTATSTTSVSTTLTAGGVYTFNLPTAVNRAYLITTSSEAYAFQISSYGSNEYGMGILPVINPCTGSRRIDFYRTSSTSGDQALVTIPKTGLASLTFRGKPYALSGSVTDSLTVNGTAYSVVSFPNSKIAPAGTVNTLTSSERFHVGVISNTGGNSTGNFGYYSAYDARVDVLNPATNQPDNFYTAAKVQPGQPVQHCLLLSSCGTTNRIRTIVSGTRTASVTATSATCLTYTMRADAPACSRDTIRVAVENELGREGSICLEFVNGTNDLKANILPTAPFVCQPYGTTSLTATASSSAGGYQYQWTTPDKQVLTTPVISTTAAGPFRLTVTNVVGCQDTTSVTVQADAPTISFAAGSATACLGSTVTYQITSTTGTYGWLVTGGTLVSGGTLTSTTATVRWTSAGSLWTQVTSPNGCTAAATQPVASATPVLSLTAQLPTCAGSTDGQISLLATGGSAPYRYVWSNGATTQNLTNLGAGRYNVTVSTAGNCTAGSGDVVLFDAPVPLCPRITLRKPDG